MDFKKFYYTIQEANRPPLDQHESVERNINRKRLGREYMQYIVDEQNRLLDYAREQIEELEGRLTNE